MDYEITLIVLCAAFFHAFWNAILKGGTNPLLDSVVLNIVWALICVVSIPFLPVPSAEVWPYIAASVAIHVSTLFLVSYSYKIGDFSVVYPIMRGLPPLLLAILSSFFLDDDINFYGWVGILVISCGILLLDAGKRPSYKVLGFACATAFSIVAYTMVDGMGARLNGNSTSFLMWFTLFQAIAFVSIVSYMSGTKIWIIHAKKFWKRGTIIAALSLAVYGTVLWAMTKAPIAYVSAIRETSVLFAILIGMLFLSEPFNKLRIASAILITLGIAIIKILS